MTELQSDAGSDVPTALDAGSTVSQDLVAVSEHRVKD